jgi:uncharacterized protein (DUF433 family)
MMYVAKTGIGVFMARYPLTLPSELKREAERLADQQGVSLNQFILWSVAEKVGALHAGLDDPNFPNITYRRGASGQLMPVLRGTGIRVQTIVIAAQDWKLSPSQIAEEYDFSESRVKEALSFYKAHHAEVDANIQAEQDLETARAAVNQDG